MKFIILLLIIFLAVSCKENTNKNYSEDIVSDSLSYYMKKANSQNIDTDEKLKNLDNSYSFVVNLKNSKKNRDTLFSIVLKYYNLKEWEKFISSSNKLYINSVNANDSINISNVFRYKGGYFKRIELYDSSFTYYVKAEKYFLKLKDQSNYANNLLNKGIVQYAINDYLGAELSLSKAYYIFKESDDKNKLYGTLNQLGLVCNELKEYERAESFHLQALELVKEFKLEIDEHQEAVCYNNIGYLYIKQNNYKKASENFESALADKTIIKDDPELYSSLIDNLAYCRLKINNYNELPQLFFEALKVRKKIVNTTLVVGSFIHISEYYYKIKNLPLALDYSNQALRTAQESKIPVNIILALKHATIVDNKNSSKYSEDYVRISDSLQLAERNSKDRFARIQLETDELIKKNYFLEEVNRNTLNYLFASVLIFGFLLYMRTQRAKTRYLILEQSQQRANEDIYRLIISQQDKIDEGRSLEKGRISKEIHDGILGRLFGLRLNLDGLNNRTDNEAEKERLNYILELKLIEQDLREISHELNRETTVLINNFVSIINRLFDEQVKISKASLTSLLDDNINWNLLSNTTKINLYRIIQECLQNINKYAKAKNITIAFKKDTKGNLILSIFDDGIGFDENTKTKGIGLTNIIERTHESLGTIEINTGKNKGTAITITVPLESKTIKI